MARSLFLNDELLSESQPCLFADERGFLYGDGIFTTIRCYHGVPFRLERHVARLNASLASAEIAIPFGVEEKTLRERIGILLERNHLVDAVARFYVTRGRGMGLGAPSSAKPTTLLTVNPLPDPLPSKLSLHITSVRRDPDGKFERHKGMSYASSLLARREANAAGFDEGVILDTHGHLLECAASNLFLVEGRILYTAGTDQNLLPGIAREIVLTLATSLGVAVKFQPISRAKIATAEEAFVTNSVIEVVPVWRIDDRILEVPGRVTKRLMEGYRTLVEQEIAAG